MDTTSNRNKSGRPHHPQWNGYQKVFLPNGRCAAKCENCLEVQSNTGSARLIAHRNRCLTEQASAAKDSHQVYIEKKPTKPRSSGARRESHWAEPGPELPEECQGFLISSALNTLGEHLAKCKECGTEMDGKAEYLREHREVCGQYTVEVRDYFEDPLNEEEMIEEIVEQHPMVEIPEKKRKMNIVHSWDQNIGTLPRPAATDCKNCAKKSSRFADVFKVWERKFEELPLEQALGIEKKMGDMLFDAHLAYLQAQKTSSCTAP